MGARFDPHFSRLSVDSCWDFCRTKFLFSDGSCWTLVGHYAALSCGFLTLLPFAKLSCHFQDNISSFSFSDTDAWFATCQESLNNYEGMMKPNFFMGPSLFEDAQTEGQQGTFGEHLVNI
jgi:hypothetical protein